jgi:hypothetical protein
MLSVLLAVVAAACFVIMIVALLVANPVCKFSR